MLEELSGLDGGALSSPSQANLTQLEKALSAGSGAGYQSTGARALVYEDLESTLRVVTFGEEHFKKTLFARLKEKAQMAKSVVHEFNRFTDYGDTGAFAPEVTTVQAIDANFQRDFAQVRFLRTKRQVSTVAQLTNTMENLVAAQTTAGARYLVKTANRYLFDGDNSCNVNEWDGIFRVQQTKGIASHYIDKAGATLNASDLDNGAYLMQQEGSWGTASDLYMPLTVQYSLDQNLIGSQQRVNLYNAVPGTLVDTATGFGGQQAFYAGQALAGFRSSAGLIKFQASEFTRQRQVPYKDPVLGTEVATSTSAPSTPVVTLVVGAGGNAGSRLSASTIYYRVAAENSSGESVCSAAQSAVVTAGGTVTVQIAAPSGGWVNAPTAFKIYAGSSASATYLIARIVNGLAYSVGATPGLAAQTTAPVAGAYAATYQDGGQRLPNTHRVYMLDLDSPGEIQAMNWVQLAPMTKEDLPRGDTFIQWMQFLFGTPVFYAPNKIVIYDNVAGAV